MNNSLHLWSEEISLVEEWISLDSNSSIEWNSLLNELNLVRFTRYSLQKKWSLRSLPGEWPQWQKEWTFTPFLKRVYIHCTWYVFPLKSLWIGINYVSPIKKTRIARRELISKCLCTHVKLLFPNHYKKKSIHVLLNATPSLMKKEHVWSILLRY